MSVPLLGTETATRYVYGTGTRDSDTGRWQEATPTTETFVGSFQPVSGREREALPAGVRTSDALTVYTETDLQTADQHAGTQADEVEYDGKRYRVEEVERWPKLLTHTKALLVRTKE